MKNTLSRVRDVAQPKFSLHQHLGQIAVGTLVVVSACLGAYASWHFGSHSGVVLALGLAVAAVAGECLKPFAFANAFDAITCSEPGRFLANIAIALVCAAYSIVGHVYLSTLARSDLTATRSAESRALTDARQDRQRALDELKSIGHPRSKAELKPLITSATALAGNCLRIETATQRESCKLLPNLQAEAARYDRKVLAEASLAGADQRIAASKTTVEKVADPLAKAFVVYLKAIDHNITEEDAGPILALVPMMLLEVATMFAVSVTRRRDESDDPEMPRRAPDNPILQASPSASVALSAPDIPAIRGEPATTTSVRDAADRIAALARERGGTLTATSKREVARLIDASPPTTSRALAALAGVAAVTIDQTGIAVKMSA